ncbi:MAG: AAA family ATPase [Acidimicrobiia bacterium]
MQDRAQAMDIRTLGQSGVLRGELVDVSRQRESHRLRRLLKVAILLALLLAWLVARPGLPTLPDQITDPLYLPMWMLVLVVLGGTVFSIAGTGRSPHVLYRSSEIPIGFDDVVGLGMVKDEVVRTLNLFLAYRTFQDRMGGNPRRAILFEGPPGTGKTYMAKAMAHEAGVPFLFVSSSAFQSQFYGQTNRKIRSFFKQLRKAARREGGAIGFIEEIDAIATARAGMRNNMGVAAAATVHRATTEGVAGVVNELLVQLQSFDEPTFGERTKGRLIDACNTLLPSKREIRKRPPATSNILVIGATNRASDLDAALLRPGRFDRSIHFDLPNKSGRREIIDYYMTKKAHADELDRPERRDQLAAMTFGYSPVMIEHLFDEALVWTLRDGRDAMHWEDVQQAKMTTEIGLKQPVEYTPEEQLTIATHESGHAVVAYLEGKGRKLEVLSIVKRAESLGLLAHSETEERYTRTRSELLTSIQIAFGGMTAEELFFGESGTGPSSDLAHATKVAAQMVGSFGMAGSLVSYEAVESAVAQGIVAKVLSNDEGRASVERILNQAKDAVRQLLDEHRHLVVALRDALIAREELVGDEILAVIHDAERVHRGEPAAPARLGGERLPVDRLGGVAGMREIRSSDAGDAHAACAAGEAVVIVGPDAGAVGTLVTELRAAGGQAVGFVGDPAGEPADRAALDAMAAELGAARRTKR